MTGQVEFGLKKNGDLVTRWPLLHWQLDTCERALRLQTVRPPTDEQKKVCDELVAINYSC